MGDKKEAKKDGINSTWTIGNTIKVSFTVDGVDCFLEVGLLELKRLLNYTLARDHQTSERPAPSNCPTGKCDL